jgi:predicted phosphoribosyltransferase/dienelactone hydrolase
MFADRVDAGTRLAAQLSHLRGQDVVVVGLPRGGVPVAYQVARSLGAPLDVILVRKLGVPYQPELAMGAIGEDGVRVLSDEVIAMTGVGEPELAQVEARERVELERRAERYRSGRERVPLDGKVVVVVDDGVATGATARAACEVARHHGAARVVLAAPTAPSGWTKRMGDAADEYVAVKTPKLFWAIGQFYRDFSPTGDDEVVRYLDRSRTELATVMAAEGDEPPAVDGEVALAIGAVTVAGRLTIPDHAGGIVVFAHGAGSSRHSPRNRHVARVLNEAGLATLLFDLLTEREEMDRARVFDIDLLAERLVAVTAWVRRQAELVHLPVGYFGASTGAAAALVAAALGDGVAAVVSRGGRPDLAGDRLPEVRAPTLLIVGGEDHLVLDLNRRAREMMRCPTDLVVIPGATHLFEEPGTLDAAASAATSWFVTHLAQSVAREV